MERLDKYLSAHTALSRRDAVDAVRRGRIAVNGTVCRNAAEKIDPENTMVTFDGQAVAYRAHIYIMMNKPKGVVSATRDANERTVVDLLPAEWRHRELFPAGRLDKDTTGMVLLTDDGDFAHRMLAPKKHVPKCYLVTLDRPVENDAVTAFESGITLADGDVCRPAQCRPLDGNQAHVTLHEGKYHQVKRMFAACGYHVEELHRLSMGGLRLDEQLALGESRLLSETEAMTVFEP